MFAAMMTRRQQAQFYADLAEMDERLNENAQQIRQVIDLTYRMGRIVEAVGERLDRLAAAQERTDEQLRKTGELARMTDQRLNRLIQRLLNGDN